MVMIPLLSLIIPYYRNRDSIDAVLVSLNIALRQCASFRIEVVFISNNSDDGTEEKVRNFTVVNGCVVHVEEKNQGVSNARNAGLAVSSGEYIAFLDADDAIEANYFFDISRVLKRSPDVVFLRHDALDEVQASISLSTKSMLQNHLKGWWNWQFVFKKSLASGVKFHGACFEDFGFFPYILARAENCVVLKRGLYRYNDNPASVTKRSIGWRISELQGQFERLRLSPNELGADIYKRVQRDFYEHISLLRAIAGQFPVLGMAESLALLRLSCSWRVRYGTTKRLLRLNGSTLYGLVRGLMKWSSR